MAMVICIFFSAGCGGNHEIRNQECYNACNLFRRYCRLENSKSTYRDVITNIGIGDLITASDHKILSNIIKQRPDVFVDGYEECDSFMHFKTNVLYSKANREMYEEYGDIVIQFRNGRVVNHISVIKKCDKAMSNYKKALNDQSEWEREPHEEVESDLEFRQPHTESSGCNDHRIEVGRVRPGIDLEPNWFFPTVPGSHGSQ